MTPHDIRALLERLTHGDLALDAAVDELAGKFRQQPFEDLGFARVDHHRASRQGFPEVILGLGKSADQVAAIAERIVSRGHSLLVTRADAAMYAAVRAQAPAAVFHETARAITLKAGDIAPGQGTVLIAAAGTSDLPSPKKPPSRPRRWGMSSIGCTTSASPDFIGCSASTTGLPPLASSSSSPGWKARCRASSRGW